MKRKLGFTLIELVFVIVILGILAVIAVPKFMSIETDARKADLQQLAATLKSNIEIMYAKAIIEGKETAINSTIDGIKVANGYPIASNMGIAKLLQLSKKWHVIQPTVVGQQTHLSLFSLYAVKDTDVIHTLKSGCYVLYTYYPMADFEASLKHKKAIEKQSWLDWWNESPQAKIEQANVYIMKHVICTILTYPGINIAKLIPICPQYPKPAENRISKIKDMLPTISIVDNKC